MENNQNELLDELKKTRSDMNAGMFGKKNTEASGKIGAGCLILIIVLVIFLIVFLAS